jgi:hydroxymethylglutaryl-CoA lyase
MLNVFETVNQCPKPTIALVKGDSYGGGVGLAFCCDFRVVLGGKKFVLTEVKRGLIPATISKYLVREWGPTFAREVMITGRPITAEELLQRNLITSVVHSEDEAREKVHEIAELLRTSAPRAVGQTKQLVNSVAERKNEGEEIEKVFVDMMGPSEEAKYGIGEFRKGVRLVDWMEWYQTRTKDVKPKL